MWTLHRCGYLGLKIQLEMVPVEVPMEAKKGGIRCVCVCVCVCLRLCVCICLKTPACWCVGKESVNMLELFFIH